jgi:hypothetical protein
MIERQMVITSLNLKELSKTIEVIHYEPTLNNHSVIHVII